MDQPEDLRLWLEVYRCLEPSQFEPGSHLNLLERAIVRLNVWVSGIEWFLFGDPGTRRFMADTAYMHWILGLCCIL